MATDWETRYYEQQALHTESNGILGQERDRALAKLAEMTRERDTLREQLEVKKCSVCESLGRYMCAKHAEPKS